MTTALITGATGQDGSYLAEFLLTKGYRVIGMVRRSSSPSNERIAHLRDLELVTGDLADQSSLNEAIRDLQPDEVYHLAAQSFVPTSWNQPVLTGDLTGLGTARMLEACRQLPKVRFYQASSSEMFGQVSESPQNEQTPFHPRSPYGCAKAYAHHLTVNYRESYGMHASCGILFNHESPRRGLEFVSRKVTDYVARFSAGALTQPLKMGNLDALRDWGAAQDYVRAMWLMLQQSEPGDYVIGTGEQHSVRELLDIAFAHVGLDYREHVMVDPALYRPAEVNSLLADATKAREVLGWEPTVTFRGLIEGMVDADVERFARVAA